MREKHYQMIGLVGFLVAGVIFIATGIRYGDSLTILGSVVWMISCLIWMIPLFQSRDD